MRASIRSMTSALAAATVLVLATMPAAASHTTEHALEEIDQVVAEASAAMAVVDSQFESAVALGPTPEEIEAMLASAIAAVHRIDDDADDELRTIKQTDPPHLGKAVAAARQRIRDTRDVHIVHMEEMAANEADGGATTTTTTTTTTVATTTTTVPTTTTSTAPVTTTTTAVATTTTTQPGTTTTSQPGATTTTTTQPGTTTTSQPGAATTTTTQPGTTTTQGTTTTTTTRATTTTTSPPAATTTSTTLQATTTTSEPGGDSSGAAAREEPPPGDPAIQAMAAVAPSATVEEATSAAPLTGTLARSLEVVLPPAVVTVALSPLTIVEILASTILESGMSILFPTGLLLMSLFSLDRIDRRRRRRLRLQAPDLDAG